MVKNGSEEDMGIEALSADKSICAKICHAGKPISERSENLKLLRPNVEMDWPQAFKAQYYNYTSPTQIFQTQENVFLQFKN